MPRKRRSSRSYKKKNSFGLKKKTIRAISALGFTAFSILAFFSIFSQAVGLDVLHTSLSQFFGVGLFFVPVLTFLLALYLWRFKLEATKPHVLIGIAIFLAAFTTMVAAFSQEKAGEIGYSIWTVMSQLVTTPGAFVVSLAAMIVGLLVLFNTSYDDAAEMITKGIGGSYSAIMALFHRGGNETDSPFAKHPGPVIQGGSIPQAKPTNGAAVPAQQQGLGTQMIANLPNQGDVWEYPPLSLLSDSISKKAERGDIKHNAAVIEKTLDSFGIQARVAEINLGPAVTQYALEIALGTKLSKITALQNDLALALAAPTGAVRIEAPIPGKSLVGIEIPNRSLEIVSLSSILSSDTMQANKSHLAVALGYDVSGQPVVADIARMPHILMAGTTGSGKSVMINSFIASLLFRCSPKELKLILIDPKRVEMVGYNSIPHLLTPVIVDVDKIVLALKWATGEMDRRYKEFAKIGVRNIEGYNETAGFQALPYLVIIIDELADLMAFAPVDVEDAITRLAQMARATGIHLVVATQRPSVDVITGLIKANIPARIAFNVASMIDSRVILDQPGAEKLLGRGDMLYLPPDAAKPVRIQGVYVSDDEVHQLVNFMLNSGLQPEYVQEVTETSYQPGSGGGGSGNYDALFIEAVRTIMQYDRASASLLQRRLKVGYARAARLIDELEAAGVITPAEGANKGREVVVQNAQAFLQQQAGGQEAAAQ